MWLLNECSEPDVEPIHILEPAAIEILPQKLITPLQINQHLVMALEAGHAADERPVSAGIVQSIIAPNLTVLGKHTCTLRLRRSIHCQPS